MSDGFVRIAPDSSGKYIDNAVIMRDGDEIYRQRVESYPANAFGDLTADAWGVPKVSVAHSVFHGLWTFDVPPRQWFMYENGVQVYTSTHIISENGEGVVKTSAAKSTVLMESRATPRYQPNRGHLYSTALWCPTKIADGIRSWGLGTTENCVCFKLKADGKLYAVLRSGGVQKYEQEIDTSVLPTFDVEKGNVYDIQYQWRGVGNYSFFINLKFVHEFDHLGTLTALSLEDPALPAFMKAERTTEDVEIHAGCVDISSENGNDDRLQYASAYAQKSVSGTDVPVICVLNPLQINGKTNTRNSEVARITFNCDKKSLFKVWATRDPTAITGATFVGRGNGSFMQVDSPDSVATAVSATAVTVAKLQLITALPLVANGVGLVTNPDKNKIDFNLARGDYLVVTNTVSVGACEVVVEWGEAI
jgi:hypothetical protein